MSTLDDNTYKADEIPESITVPYTVYYVINGYSAGKLGVYTFDWNGDKDSIIICKGKVRIKIDRPDNIAQRAISYLREAIKDEQAASYKKIRALEETIDKLSLLEYKP